MAGFEAPNDTCQNDEQAKLFWRDVLALLQTIPENWTEFDRDCHTDAQAKALYMLVAAGFVERRGWIRVRFAGLPNSFEVRYQATGEGGFGQALASAVAAMFVAWEDAWNRWTAGPGASGVPFVTESLKPELLSRVVFRGLGSGGVLQDSVGENFSFENKNDLVMPVESSPTSAG